MAVLADELGTRALEFQFGGGQATRAELIVKPLDPHAVKIVLIRRRPARPPPKRRIEAAQFLVSLREEYRHVGICSAAELFEPVNSLRSEGYAVSVEVAAMAVICLELGRAHSRCHAFRVSDIASPCPFSHPLPGGPGVGGIRRYEAVVHLG